MFVEKMEERFKKQIKLENSQKRDKKGKEISEKPMLSINMILMAVKTP